jgi:hypothetical protein
VRARLLVVGLLAVGGLAVVGASCAVDDALTCGAACDPNGGVAMSTDASSGADGAMVTADGSSGGLMDGNPAPTDGAPKDTATADVPCTVTCPSSMTCMGAACYIVQGPVCSAAVLLPTTSGTFSGTVCVGVGTGTLTTTCASPISSQATFIRFPATGGPFAMTLSSLSGALQVQVGSCATGTCYTVPSGGSTASVPVLEGATVGIVSAGGCATFTFTYSVS